MRNVDVTEATAALADYAKALHDETLVITENGKPLAALMPVGDADAETVSLSTNPEFLALIERSRASLRESGGISSEEVRRQLGLSESADAT